MFSRLSLLRGVSLHLIVLRDRLRERIQQYNKNKKKQIAGIFEKNSKLNNSKHILFDNNKYILFNVQIWYILAFSF